VSWPTVALGEVATVVSGATPRTSEKRFWGGDVLWTTPKDLSDLETPYLTQPARTITGEGLKSCAASVLPANSVLLSSRAPIGLVAINSLPMATNQGFKSLVPDERSLDSKFLYHWLKAKTFLLQSLGNGATFKEISKAVVERIEIPLPPLEEQRRIAAILDKADALRRKHKRALELLDSLTQSIFLDMFGDPVGNPKGWAFAPLGDVIHKASDGPHVSPVYSESGIPFLSTRHVQKGSIVWEDLKFIDQAQAETHWKKCRPERGDILYTKGGTTGLAAMVDTDEPFAVWVHIALLKTNRERVEPIWLESMLNTQYSYRQSQRYTHGIANHDLGLKRMVKIQIYLPPLSDQRRFVNAAKMLIGLRKGAERGALEEDLLFCSLQQRAFSGQL
jgi:type I restriction enzyme, S subunit